MRSMVITAVLAAGSASLMAQSAPIKMGLWEKTMVTSNGDGAPATMKAKSCITPVVWQEMVSQIQRPHDGCKMNTVKTGNGYTFNGTCNIPPSPALVISGSQTIQDSEHIVSDSHSTSTTNGKTRKTDIHSVSRFLSSSCGSVKPDDPDVE
jgi:uncharacterized protein DUF3617